MTGSATVSPRGIPMQLHPRGDVVSDVIRDTGDFYEADILDVVGPLVAGGIVIDVGAHIGNHAVFMAALGWAGEVHAFEPFPANVPLLLANVAPYPNVAVYPAALSDRRQRLRMVTWSANLGHAMVDDRGHDVVDAVALDDMEFADVRLIKVDVEGHEPEVLAGARRTIERSRPLILVEDWPGRGYDLPGYAVVASWPDHQTYLYEATADGETTNRHPRPAPGGPWIPRPDVGVGQSVVA